MSLSFKVDIHKPHTFRDLAIRLARDPLDFIVKEKDRLIVAKDLNFEIREGERVGLLGVNGAGKTSLCRCIAGMYRPTKGEVTAQGPVRAIFSTQVGIQPELTGRENAELLSHFLFPGEKDAHLLVKDALEFSELGEFVDVPFRLYSNGMQTRLTLSLVSARPARLLIMDEVFDGADAYFREKIGNRVLSMIQKSGAVVFVSHVSEQIRKICNRVLVLHQGRVAYDGPPHEAIAYYESLFVQKRLEQCPPPLI